MIDAAREDVGFADAMVGFGLMEGQHFRFMFGIFSLSDAFWR